MATKFVFATMMDDAAVYRTPKGNIYDIQRGQPFKVEDKDDIEFFGKNKRFQKAGAFAKLKADKTDLSVKFREKLLEIEDFGEDVAELVVEIYVDEEKFVEHITTGAPLDPSIPDVEKEMLLDKFLPNEMKVDNPDEKDKDEESEKVKEDAKKTDAAAKKSTNEANK